MKKVIQLHPISSNNSFLSGTSDRKPLRATYVPQPRKQLLKQLFISDLSVTHFELDKGTWIYSFLAAEFDTPFTLVVDIKRGKKQVWQNDTVLTSNSFEADMIWKKLILQVVGDVD